MIEAKLAPVKPRILSPQTGETVLLEDAIRELLEAGIRGQIWIVGPLGAGKTTALQHLAAVYSGVPNVSFLDAPNPKEGCPTPNDLLVCTSTMSPPRKGRAYRLSPWGDDERIEYLLACHKDQCASVMTRLKACTDRGVILGNAELWRLVLDQMAGNETLQAIKSSLRAFLESKLTDPEIKSLVSDFCLAAQTDPTSANEILKKLAKRRCEESLRRAVLHGVVQVVLAAERMVTDLVRGANVNYLTKLLSRELIREAASLCMPDYQAVLRLMDLVQGPKRKFHPMAVSLLHIIDPNWTPAQDCIPLLAEAYLSGAHWPGVHLEKADIRRTDFRYSDLQKANLNNASAGEADFSNADLRAASLAALDANGANLSHANLAMISAQNAQFGLANLEGANLEGADLKGSTLQIANLTEARLVNADLRQAKLTRADIEEADFSGANLEGASLGGLKLGQAKFVGARFARADLTKCDLEGMSLPSADFENAVLVGAYLTGSSMPGANFLGARLCSAGLADIEWEGAILREADLTGATFHLGSSRSGLVGSPIASEGSRTGFYTDDYNEQDFKAPEEIRKANLCGADLRGAKIEGVDFYLVDLRNAQYDREQEEHFRRCGAILETRAQA
jgi:uncharacterized protein YjbI with pentapeptide repeats